MCAVPNEVFDAARLDAVRRTGLLDTPAEPAFDRLAGLAADLLGAPLAFVTLVDDQRSFWKAAHGVEVESAADRQNTVEESFCQYVIRRPGRLMIDDAVNDPLTRDNPSVATMGVRAWAGVTLEGPDGAALGSFCVVDTVVREWTEHDGDVLETLAAAASAQIALAEALARERALLEAERDVSKLLQSALLPTELAIAPGLQTAARYRPADDRVKVGGDFYDVFEGGDGSVIAVVGDVCGKGPRAAAATGMARWTLRSRSQRATDPAPLLAHLDRVLYARPRMLSEGDFITLVVARLRSRITGGFDVELATAGHPSALLSSADGATTMLSGHGPPVGVVRDAVFTATSGTLEAGGSLVLFTDGLLDAQAPGRQLAGEDLIGPLRAGLSADAAADALLDFAVGEAHARDDVALLVLRAL